MNERLRKSHIADRVKKLESGCGLDWATAEALAMGTLLHQGGCGSCSMHYSTSGEVFPECVPIVVHLSILNVSCVCVQVSMCV